MRQSFQVILNQFTEKSKDQRIRNEKIWLPMHQKLINDWKKKITWSFNIVHKDQLNPNVRELNIPYSGYLQEMSTNKTMYILYNDIFLCPGYKPTTFNDSKPKNQSCFFPQILHSLDSIGWELLTTVWLIFFQWNFNQTLWKFIVIYILQCYWKVPRNGCRK